MNRFILFGLGVLMMGMTGCTGLNTLLGPGQRMSTSNNGPQELLQKGIALHRGRQYATALQRFQLVRQEYPGTLQASESLYWIGAVRLSPSNPQRSPAQAMKALRAFAAEQPGHPKAETAQILVDLLTRIQAMEKLAGQLQTEIQQLKDIHLRLERLERRLNP